MCGIAGIVDRRGVEPRLIKSMCDSMVHRGPDEEGYVFIRSSADPSAEREAVRLVRGQAPPSMDFSADLAFGHRRLSIIDLATGAQPMANEDGSVWIAYNGEIYNYRELRDRLTASGHVFSTASDTEAIVHLYEQSSDLDSFFTELNGIFAFALWDGRRGRLVLGRDRMGVKPLYWTQMERNGAAPALAFASEIKAFLTLPGFGRAVDLEALAQHFTFQNTFGDKTFFKAVKMLPPGSYLVLEAGQRPKVRRFWDMAFSSRKRTKAAWAEALRGVFEASVTRQLISDVPLGAYLSGGMDTGSISAVAGRHIEPLHTFTCGFDTSGVTDQERHFDETIYAQELAERLSTKHHKTVIHPGDMIAVMPKVLWHLDEPRVGISYQVYIVAQLVKRYVTVVLAGVGGDELFGGYPWRYYNVSDTYDPDEFDVRYFGMWQRLVPVDDHKEFFTGDVYRELGGYSLLEAAKDYLRPTRDEHPLDRAMYFDAKTFLPGLLVVEDKLGMAHSLESRVPFLDNEMVECSLAIPGRLKVTKTDFKHILKAAMAGLLPSDVFGHKKVGFTPPDESWYRTEPTSTYLKSVIFSPGALGRGYFKREFLERVWSEHMSGKKNHRFLLWSLASFEWWNRLFVDGESLPPG